MSSEIEDVEFPQLEPKVTRITSRIENAKKVLAPTPRVRIKGLVLPREEFDFICDRMAEEHRPAGEVTGAMIQRNLDLINAQLAGSTILIKSPDGKIEELVFRLPPPNVLPFKRR